MKLIIGLGNPGTAYEYTRHNVGFMCVDALVKKMGGEEFHLDKKFFSLVSEGMLNSEKILIAKPQTFMNESGKAVQALYAFYKCTPENLWIVYDDVDLPFGELRVRPTGSAGSHNGMKSIISSLGFQNFPRVRIGIESRGVDAPAQQDLASFVLEPFRKDEDKNLREVLKKSAEAIIIGLEKGVAEAQQKYN